MHVPVIALAMMPTLFHWVVLLMPLHIVLLELLIDPACAVVFEAEAEDSGLMDRPPRSINDSPFSGAQLWSGLLQGLGVALVLLAGKWWGDTNGWTAEDARTVLYLSLLLSVMVLIWSNRTDSGKIGGASGGSNPFWWWMVAGVGVVCLALIYIPWVRHLMRFSEPSEGQLVWILVLLLAVTVWLTAVRRLFSKPATAAPSST